jgi:glycosyltransferase involved in cell wall biosynthesis
MRQGQNPAKLGLRAYQPPQLGILLLVYIPAQTGYFVDSLKVLEYQVASIHKNTPVEFNLHVFDNGSCQEVRDALHNLQAKGWIDWLTLSEHNLGKPGALNWALRGMPNEILCYADGDVYFRPGWYDASLNVLKTFPLAGMVTAQPCFFDNLNGNGSAHLGLRAQEEFQFSTRPADAAIAEEYVRSVGDNPDLLVKYKQHVWEVVCDKTTGVEAVIGASPFQFLGYKSMLEKILPLTYTHVLREDVQIAARLDKLGFLQLSTLEPFVYHMGNQIDGTTRKEAQRDALSELANENPAPRESPSHSEISPAKRRAFSSLDFLVRLPIFKKSFQRIYNLLFEYYAKIR